MKMSTTNQLHVCACRYVVHCKEVGHLTCHSSRSYHQGEASGHLNGSKGQVASYMDQLTYFQCVPCSAHNADHTLEAHFGMQQFWSADSALQMTVCWHLQDLLWGMLVIIDHMLCATFQITNNPSGCYMTTCL